MKKIALIGAPRSGKSVCLKAVQEMFGSNVIVVPEAATILIDQGYEVPKVITDEWRYGFQKELLTLQLELEARAVTIARNTEADLVVCDRGIVDAFAYMQNPRALYAELGITEKDLAERYDAVLYLETSAGKSLKLSDDETMRLEDETEAIQLEGPTRAAWEQFYTLEVIPAQSRIEDKVQELLNELRSIFRLIRNGQH